MTNLARPSSDPKQYAGVTRGSADGSLAASMFPPPPIEDLGYQQVSFEVPADEVAPKLGPPRLIGVTRTGITRSAPRQNSGRPAHRSTRTKGGERGGDSGDGDSDEPPGWRLSGRDEIDRWVAERARALEALREAGRGGQLRFDGEEVT